MGLVLFLRRVGLDSEFFFAPSHQDGFNGGKNLEAAVVTEMLGNRGQSLLTPVNRQWQSQVMLDDHEKSCFDGRKCSKHLFF